MKELVVVTGPFWALTTASSLDEDEGSKIFQVGGGVPVGRTSKDTNDFIALFTSKAKAVTFNAKLNPVTFRTPGDFLDFLRDAERMGVTHVAFDPSDKVRVIPIGDIIAGISRGPLKRGEEP